VEHYSLEFRVHGAGRRAQIFRGVPRLRASSGEMKTRISGVQNGTRGVMSLGFGEFGVMSLMLWQP
jgi:hypothetical protein